MGSVRSIDEFLKRKREEGAEGSEGSERSEK